MARTASPVAALAWLLAIAAATAQAPSGLPRRIDAYMRVPADNPLTSGRAALGRRLFFERRLSNDASVSCATCHDPARAFADDRSVSVGIGGRAGTRNVPSLVNRGFGESFFWDGRARTLEAQVVQPIENPVELGFTVGGAVERLAADAAYGAEFRRVFGRPVNAGDLARALASYVRTIQSGDSAYDRALAGDPGALSGEARRGMRIFANHGLCTTCHTGATLTDERFHNTGVAWDGDRFADEGRARVTGVAADRGAFKTPSLRDVARTAPYMHDGSLESLEAVIEFYDRGGRENPGRDRDLVPLRLSASEKAALAAFLRSLDGDVTEGWPAPPRPPALIRPIQK